MIGWPGLRRSVSAIRRLFNSASFYAPLTHSAIPTRAASGTTATFTRATTATVRDNEGVLRTAIAGEARFVGARHVRNLLSGSDNLDAWGNSASAVKNAVGIEGTANSGWTLTDSSAVVFQARTLSVTLVVGSTYLSSVYVGKTSGATTFPYFQYLKGSKYVGIILNTNTGIATALPADATYDLPTSLQVIDEFGMWRVCTTYTAAGGTTGSFDLFPAASTNGTSISGVSTVGSCVFDAPQLEDITGRTDQTTPSEYVSVGVTSAPYYHGSAADGVRAYPYDLSGNPIPSTTLLGYSAEGARTNLCLQSQTFDHASWVKNESSGTVTITANNGIAPDGTLTAEKIEFVAPVSGNQALLDQTIAVSAASVYAGGIYLKAFAAGDVGKKLVFRHAGGAGYTELTLTADWQRLSHAETAAAASCVFSFGLRPAVGGSSGTVTAYVWGAQVELGSFASSYIATTTVAVARNADVLTYSSAGNILGTAGWCYAEWTYPRAATTTTSPRIINTGAGSVPLYLASAIAGDLGLYDGAVRDGPTPAYPVTTPTKSASTWGGTAATITNAGVSVTTAFDGDMNVGSTIDIACINGTGGFELNGTIRNVRIGQRAISSSELGAITA